MMGKIFVKCDVLTVNYTHLNEPGFEMLIEEYVKSKKLVTSMSVFAMIL